MMRAVLPAAILATVLMGCAPVPGPTPATPRAAAAITADAVVVRVNEVQAALIDYCGPAPECAPGTLPTATAREAVQLLIDVRSILKTAPDGWQAAAKAAWARARLRLDGVTTTALALAIGAADALFAGL
jgi:hypothetical protein